MNTILLHIMTSRLNHLIWLFLVPFLLVSCKNESQTKQFEYAGGTFSFAIDNEPSTFIPYNLNDAYSAILLDQIYEGLVSLNPATLEIEPRLAEKWEILDNGFKYRFTLRKDVYFHTHKDIEGPNPFSAADVLSTIMKACTPVNGGESFAYSTLYKPQILGAREFFEGKADSISGIKIEGNTIEIELLEKDFSFIDKLAQTQTYILSKKAIEKGYESELIGTGPFKFSEYVEEDGLLKIVLLRNENYYEKDEEGNSLPYLNQLVLVVENQKMIQLELFEEDKIQLIQALPPSEISTMLGEGKIKDFNDTPPKLILIRKPLLSTHYFQFNLMREEFQDVRVRKAFNYAIDKEAIVRTILNNQAFSAGNYGIVPPVVFNGYDAESVKKNAYPYDPDKARELLSQAGYPNGVGFPTFDIKYSIGAIPSAVSDEVANHLKRNLNINVNLDGMPFQTLLEEQERGNGVMFKTAWVADYYSPETFLLNFYGKNVQDSANSIVKTNYTRYNNPKFDAAFEKAKNATNLVEQYENFVKAEIILMKDAPFIPLWYDESIKIAYSKVRNLHLNEMNFFSFRKVYIKEWTKEEWEEANSK